MKARPRIPPEKRPWTTARTMEVFNLRRCPLAVSVDYVAVFTRGVRNYYTYVRIQKMATIKLKPRKAELHPLHSVRHYETGMTELTLKLTRWGISSSNWILMSCQPHRVTPGKSNSGHKQIHISKLFSHNYISTLCHIKSFTAGAATSALRNERLCWLEHCTAQTGPALPG